MSSKGNSGLFDSYYFAYGCGDRPYRRDPDWLAFYDGIAERIARDIQPETVLDAGCAMGFLVEGLRDKGVEAYGVDISEYAIEKVHPDIQPYCWVGSVTEAFPQKYDLIVSIEVLEHLQKEEAEEAVANFCQHTDDILFSSSPDDYKEATHFNVQPPEYWVSVFARHGFYRDVDFDASFITPWTVRFRKQREPLKRLIASYERKLWNLIQESHAQRELNVEMRNELANKEKELERAQTELKEHIRQIQGELTGIRNSTSWRLVQRIQHTRERLIPQKSWRERRMYQLFRLYRAWRRDGTLETARRVFREVIRRVRTIYLRTRYRRRFASRAIEVGSLETLDPVPHHQATVDIVICVHNALEDVRRCLESVVRYTTGQYSLLLVDDGSDHETQEYLDTFAQSQGVTLLRNEQARGYTRAANKGLSHSTGDYVILLNSDTVVSPQWLDRMIACAESDSKIGMVGPLSNTASWQSIPEIFNEQGDWASNTLPKDLSIPGMAKQVARYSARLYPRIPILNGFCLLIKRELIEQIGVFDEETFGAGYGEENDYCLRAQKAGWEFAIADDVYIFHAHSKSYSTKRRLELGKNADAALVDKHGQGIISEGVKVCRYSPVLLGIRARNRTMETREKLIKEGLIHWEGKRVLFILPLIEPGGGGHVIIQESKAMRRMGVDVRFLNLRGARARFEASYPENTVPVIYTEEARLSRDVISTFDAVVATVYHTVGWMDAIMPRAGKPLRAYYIQDFELRFFPEGSPERNDAKASYTLFPDLIRFAKTEWNCAQVQGASGVACSPVGPSLDIDLFRPRRKRDPEWPTRPLRISAMIRPSTPRRQAKFTMEVLWEFQREYKNDVEVVLFGCQPDDPEFHALSKDFPWRHAGMLTRTQLALLLNEMDIFIDFSSYQAMGLTAMEAMACGAAVILPEVGGARSFASHESNALLVDTSSQRKCLLSLERLFKDQDLRTQIQRQAILDICQYPPELAAFNLLKTVFGFGV